MVMGLLLVRAVLGLSLILNPRGAEDQLSWDGCFVFDPFYVCTSLYILWPYLYIPFHHFYPLLFFNWLIWSSFNFNIVLLVVMFLPFTHLIKMYVLLLPSCCTMCLLVFALGFPLIPLFGYIASLGPLSFIFILSELIWLLCTFLPGRTYLLILISFPYYNYNINFLLSRNN